jgi:hypothetical protein
LNFFVGSGSDDFSVCNGERLCATVWRELWHFLRLACTNAHFDVRRAKINITINKNHVSGRLLRRRQTCHG